MNAQHLRHQFLREREVLGFDSVRDRQQPSRQPGLDRVQAIAGRGLSNLDEAGFRVQIDHGSNRRGAQAFLA
jgi:hypothetical protein